MLADYESIPTLGVSDLQRARDFYEGVLGFSPLGEAAEGVTYSSGSSFFLVYPSTYAGTNKATAMSFRVPADAFDAEVQSLVAKAVPFQTFEVEGITWEGVVARYGDTDRAAWFEDPDGNILNIEASPAAG